LEMEDIVEIISLTNRHLITLPLKPVDEYSNLRLNCTGSCKQNIRISKNLYQIKFWLFEISKLVYMFISFTQHICKYIYTMHIMFADIFSSFIYILCYPASLRDSN
jgi:hypothetical protein